MTMPGGECRFDSGRCEVHDDARDPRICLTAADALRARCEKNGATCSACGFRYREHHGHIIPCPVCALAQERAKVADMETLIRVYAGQLAERRDLLATRDAQVGALREALIDLQELAKQILALAAGEKTQWEGEELKDAGWKSANSVDYGDDL